MPCTAPFVDPSLVAARQQDLTRATELAFFRARLQNDMQADLFLRTRLAVENQEISSQLH
jgi:hypothetical protein